MTSTPPPASERSATGTAATCATRPSLAASGPEAAASGSSAPASSGPAPAQSARPAPGSGRPVALVTGASRGLGAALALALGEAGWHVLAVARGAGGLEALDDRIRTAGGEATLAPMDLADPGAIAHLASSIAERWGGLGLWAHAAVHAAPLAPAAHIAAKDMTSSITINLAATAALIPALNPLLLAHRGTALFFDDPQGGVRFHGAYGATKAAQIALARSWQAESARLGPRVVIARPAPMPTATRARFFPGEDRSSLADPTTEARRILGECGLAGPV